MYSNYIISASVILTLSGCGTTHDTKRSLVLGQPAPRQTYITENIACETLKAFKRHLPALPDGTDYWLITVTGDLVTKDTTILGVDPLKWTIPSNTVVFIPRLKSTYEDTRTPGFEINIKADGTYAPTEACKKTSERDAPVFSPTDFGVNEWVQSYPKREDGARFSTFKSIKYKIKVVWTIDGGLGATIENGGFSTVPLSANRSRAGTLDLDFAATAAANEPEISAKGANSKPAANTAKQAQEQNERVLERTILKEAIKDL